MFKKPIYNVHEAKAERGEITWKKGMKLEVLDPFGNWNEMRVATVTEIMNDGFLKVNFFNTLIFQLLYMVSRSVL